VSFHHVAIFHVFNRFRLPDPIISMYVSVCACLLLCICLYMCIYMYYI